MIYLSGVITIAALACWILVVVKVFQSGNTGMGICCICPLFAFIYGWIKCGELEIRNIMLIWTGIVVVNIVLRVLAAQAMAVH